MVRRAIGVVIATLAIIFTMPVSLAISAPHSAVILGPPGST